MNMKKISNTMMIIIALFWWSYALAVDKEQLKHENALTEIAIKRCSSELIEGRDYSIKVLGDGKLEISLLGKKGGELAGAFIVTRNQWEGRQRVLPENQIKATEIFVRCKQEEIKFLRESYKPPASQSDIRRLQIERCVAEKIMDYEKPERKETNGGAITGSKSPLGSVPRSTVLVCLGVGPHQTITSADTFNTCCHGRRCSVTAPNYSENNTKVCVTTECWSEDKSWGGGGCGKYTLYIEYKNVADDKAKEKFEMECLDRGITKGA